MKANGFTLVELLCAISVALIIAGYGVPQFSQLVDNHKSRVAAHAAFTSVQLARLSAINRQEEITLCGSDDGRKCSRDWGKYLLVFTDRNENGECDPTELIAREEIGLESGTMSSRLGLGRDYTRFRPDGSASLQGSIIYCQMGKPKHSRRITWNLAGRPYFGADRNGDGIVELTNGDPINC